MVGGPEGSGGGGSGSRRHRHRKLQQRKPTRPPPAPPSSAPSSLPQSPATWTTAPTPDTSAAVSRHDEALPANPTTPRANSMGADHEPKRSISFSSPFNPFAQDLLGDSHAPEPSSTDPAQPPVASHDWRELVSRLFADATADIPDGRQPGQGEQVQGQRQSDTVSCNGGSQRKEGNVAQQRDEQSDAAETAKSGVEAEEHTASCGEGEQASATHGIHRQQRVLIRDGKPVRMHNANDKLTTEQRLMVLLSVKDGILTQDEALELANDLEDAVQASDGQRVQSLLRITRPPMITSKDIIIPLEEEQADTDHTSPEFEDGAESIDAACLALLSNDQRLLLLRSVASGEMTMRAALQRARQEIEGLRARGIEPPSAPPSSSSSSSSSSRRSFLRNFVLSPTKKSPKLPRTHSANAATSGRTAPANKRPTRNSSKDPHSGVSSACVQTKASASRDSGDSFATDDGTCSDEDAQYDSDEVDSLLDGLPSFDKDEDDFVDSVPVSTLSGNTQY